MPKILQKWHCVSTVKFEDECDTVFYVEGEYNLNPNCPEWGNDTAVECLGVMEFIEAKNVKEEIA
ncbi:MAG: hypothetical protein Q8934_22960 [Bacillota bacterium]|nr:hypothetical protein [Bacillota bacterium]